MSSPLNYAPPSAWHRRRSARRVLTICFLTLAGGFVLHWGWQAANRVRTNYYFWQSMKYQGPAEQLVYGDQLNPVAVPPFEKFYQGWGQSPLMSSGTAFVHERITPGGNKRLVNVEIISRRFVGMPWSRGSANSLDFLTRVFAPPAGLSSSQMTQTDSMLIYMGEPLKNLSVYAGQADPNDPSHFVIVYENNSRKGTIDGWLRDSDQVILERRDPAMMAVTPPAPASRESSR